MFNLLTDAWIPTNTGLLSVIGAMEPAADVLDVTTSPIVRLAIVRLLVALRSWGGDLMAHREWFNLDTAFQVDGLPEASARNAIDILNMSDGNGVALSPLPMTKVKPEELAMALVVSYFCDRGGLKARVIGLPISAQMPLHVGRRVAMERGVNLREILEKNAIESSDYLPPWVIGMSYPEYDKPNSTLELFLWPWRRLQIHGDGITIAPGSPMSKEVIDPWVIDKASLKHMREQPQEKQITALVLNQASPIASWVA